MFAVASVPPVYATMAVVVAVAGAGAGAVTVAVAVGVAMLLTVAVAVAVVVAGACWHWRLSLACTMMTLVVGWTIAPWRCRLPPTSVTMTRHLGIIGCPLLACGR